MKEKKQSATRLIRRWSVAALLVMCVCAGAALGFAPGRLVGINIATDPYGVFGDHHLEWWSYNETQNPKLAKYQYIKAHQDAFDSFVLGSSAAGAYPTPLLNETFNGKFYNLCFDDADMKDNEEYCRALIEHFDVKNVVLSISPIYGCRYNVGGDSLEDVMPYEVSGEAVWDFYKRFLFADPAIGQEKLQCLAQDSYLRQDFDRFDAQTGAVDWRKEDSSRVAEMMPYLEGDGAFADESVVYQSLPEIESCMESVAAIRQMCEENGVALTVIAEPLYRTYMEGFNQAEVAAFFDALSEVTPYWDFSYTSVSQDPRYFYDAAHFRNSVGQMMLARINDDSAVYVPQDFGEYISGDSALTPYWKPSGALSESDSQKVPVLMYHHLVKEGKVENWDVMTVGRFQEQMEALKRAGYTTVDFDDLRAYVNEGVPLPPKPVVITFDDGYTSNYKLAVSVLESLDMKATIFVVGDFMGKDTYKNTGMKIPAHFSWEQAVEMENSGVIDIESHGYDIHTLKSPAGDPPRKGCLQQPGENEADYAAFLTDDCEKMQAQFEQHLEKPVTVLSYPYGKYSVLSEVILAENGIDITLTTESGNNLLVQGVPQSLRAMNRFFIKEDIRPEALIALLES